MTKYNTFLACFIIATVAFICFFVFYINGIFSIVSTAIHYDEQPGSYHSALAYFNAIFTPQLIISLILFGITSLTCKILGIVYVAKNNLVGSGEKALWIIGFVIMGFITSIVFLVMAKGKKFVD